MHYLHKFLVHIPRDLIEFGFTREELMSYAGSSADTVIANYDNTVYERDYIFTAGRWEDIYPQEAYLASDDLEWFLKELEEAMAFQKGHIDYYLEELTNCLGVDLTVITEKLWNRPKGSDKKPSVDTDLCAYYLNSIGQLLYGEYCCDSHFYNTERNSARLLPSDIALIKQNPEEWALVMRDYYE